MSTRQTRFLAALAAAAGLALGTGCRGGRTARPDAAPLLVFAAADLREALPEIAAAYRRAGGDSVVLTFGATGDLATQIANGAPADVFFAADERALDTLAARGAVDAGSRRSYAVGGLALVAAPGAGAVRALADLAAPAVHTVAIADPAHAPYGRAARQALERGGVWARVGPKVVYAPNVAQAYRDVTSGNADAGIVALAAVEGVPGAPPFVRVDRTLHDPVQQGAAVVRATPPADSARTAARMAAARRFLDFATLAPGFRILQRFGFEPPPVMARDSILPRPEPPKR